MINIDCFTPLENIFFLFYKRWTKDRLLYHSASRYIDRCSIAEGNNNSLLNLSEQDPLTNYCVRIEYNKESDQHSPSIFYLSFASLNFIINKTMESLRWNRVEKRCSTFCVKSCVPLLLHNGLIGLFSSPFISSRVHWNRAPLFHARLDKSRWK